MRIATYNVEWFNSLFDDTGRLLEDDGWSGRHGVRRAAQITALGTVFRAVDADAVMVIEAPDESRHRATHVALVQIPRLSGQAFRFEAGHHSGMKPARIPINIRPD